MRRARFGARLLAEAVQRVRRVADPERIILFGSAASGRMTRDSDVDLLLVVKDLSDARGLMVRVTEALRGLGYGFDVIPISVDRFLETREVVGTIAYPAVKYGRVIYERP